MKIGIEAQRLFRKRKHGMDIVALESLRALQRIDTANEYVVFVRPDEDDGCLEQTSSMSIVPLEAPHYGAWEQIALPRAAARHGIDVLHCTANTAPLFSPVPLVVTIHDVIYLEGGFGFRGGTWYQRLGNGYRRAVVPLVARRARTVLTVSEFERIRIRQTIAVDANRLEVVYNAFGAHFRPERDRKRLENVRLRYDLPERFIFFLGNTDPKKNLPNVIEAYVRYARSVDQPVPMVIADFDLDRLRKRLETLGSTDLERLFRLPGYVANSDLPAIYSQCALFLYPSRRESFGIPILEAMACGAPVITADRTSMPEIAGDAAELVDPDRPDRIAEAMRRILASASLQGAMRARGFRRAAGFSWDESARRLMQVYKEAVHDPVAVRDAALAPA